jgi:hypothetical protein
MFRIEIAPRFAHHVTRRVAAETRYDASRLFSLIPWLEYGSAKTQAKPNWIGARFNMSRLGSARHPILAGKEGILIGRGRFHLKSVRVQFDSSKTLSTLHWDYIELAPPQTGSERPARKRKTRGGD